MGLLIGSHPSQLLQIRTLETLVILVKFVVELISKVVPASVGHGWRLVVVAVGGWVVGWTGIDGSVWTRAMCSFEGWIWV